MIPVLAVAVSAAGDGFGGLARIGLALVWGGMTLFAGWSWLFGRWRVVLAPLVTLAARPACFGGAPDLIRGEVRRFRAR